MDTNLIQEVILAILSVLSLVLGFGVLIANKKSKTNVLYFITSLIIIFWIIFGFLVYYPPLHAYASLFGRLNFAFVSLFIISIYSFIVNFPSPKEKNSLVDYLIIGMGLLFFFLSILTGLIISNVSTEGFVKVWVYGAYSNYFYVFCIIVALAIIIRLIQRYVTEKVEEQIKIKFFVYGAICVLVFNIVFNVIYPIAFSNDTYYWLGDYSIVFFLGFTAYAIVKHHLFNIKMIATVTAAIIINMISVIEIFTAGTITERLLLALFEVIIFYGSWILVQSVKREIKFREELQVMTDQLAKANEHLKQLDAMKTEFVSLASHELLTPVSAIEGYLSMLLDEKIAKVEDPTAKRYLDNVYKSAKRLARLIADMLNISRIEEGRLSVEKKEIDVSDVIQQVIDEVRFKAEERHQKIEFQKDGWHSYADPDKVKEVVINLVGNSIKYSLNPGTIKIEVKRVPTQLVKDIWQRIEDEIKGRPLDDQEAIKSAVDSHYRALVGDEQLLISVKDQGVGIPREELPRLFKKFHRVGNYSTQESQGTGLGLYISRALTELQHGRIWPDSEGEGKGSTFSFTLPNVKAKDQIISLENESPQDKEKLKPLAKPMKSAAEEL